MRTPISVKRTWWHTSRQAILLIAAVSIQLAALATPAQPQPETKAVELPNFVQGSLDFRLLQNGNWLVLDKKQLRLLSSSGNELAAYKVRAKHFDLRESPNSTLAVLIDSDTQHALPIRIQGSTLKLESGLPEPTNSLESTCLFRDAQQLTHVFLIAKDGQAQQWLLDGGQARLVRNLSLPANAKFCEVDDETESLYVNEEHFGVWSYSAQSESSAARKAVLLRRPYGRLQAGAHAIHRLPNGLVILNEAGNAIHFTTKKIPTAETFKTITKANYKSWPAEVGLLRSIDTSITSTIYLRDDLAKKWLPVTTISQAKNKQQRVSTIPVLVPQVQTEVMSRMGDAADDPAIWQHPSDAKLSRILGTNKKQGLLVYDLQGKQTQLLEVGRLNNVDVRQNLRWSDGIRDIAISTQRDDNSLVIFEIDPQGTVHEANRIATGMDKIYGTCLYQPSQGGLEAFVNDKDGLVQHWRIERKDGGYVGTQLRQFKIASQPEGCVVDDQQARLFIGEEKRGVWLVNANILDKPNMQLIAKVGEHLHADVEGLAIYRGKKTSYLVVSSQGDNSYIVYDAQAPFKYQGKFRIGFNTALGIDGSSETDGLEVSSANFGGVFEQGILVVQDGHKRLPDGAQNFKYIDWKQIKSALKLAD